LPSFPKKIIVGYLCKRPDRTEQTEQRYISDICEEGKTMTSGDHIIVATPSR